MPPRFQAVSFQFEKGETVPEHEEGFAFEAPRNPDMWHIDGFDTFDRAGYSVAVNIESPEVAQMLFRARLRAVESSQPSTTSGGQEWIQDRTYLVGPCNQQIKSSRQT